MYGVVYVAYTNGQMGFMRTTCGIFSAQCPCEFVFVCRQNACLSLKKADNRFISTMPKMCSGPKHFSTFSLFVCYFSPFPSNSCIKPYMYIKQKINRYSC